MSAPLSATIDPIAPLRLLVEQVLARTHGALTAFGLDPAGGGGWLLAVAGLVVVVRLLLLPLAVRQLRSQRRMRRLAPDLQRLRERYRGRSDREARESMAKDTAALYREHGVHPLAAVLPALIQLPVLLALVQVLEAAAHGIPGALATFAAAPVLGVPLSAGVLAGGAAAAVGAVVLVLTAGAQLLTARVAAKGDPAAGAPAQRVLMLALPLVSVGSCVAFPIGVTAYWLCSAVWTLGQQATLTQLIR
jgi:YidC/Oxa1 family membrane protein insertase